MKVYITGIAGMLGYNLFKNLTGKHEVSGCDIINADFVTDVLDLTDFDKTREILAKCDFDVLIHTAANINVDGCEDNPESAFLLNAEVTNLLAQVCEQKKAKLVYISTDAVFSGKKNGTYSENDESDPINIYGMSKLKGEEYVLGTCSDFLILRTNIYGWNYQNKTSFAEWVLSSLENKEHINMFTDVLYTPIYIGNFTKALIELLEQEVCGLYNLVGSENCSKYEFGKILADVFELDSSLITPVSVETFNFKAKRSNNMRLSNKKIRSIVATKLLNVEEGIRQFYNDRK